MMRLSIHLFCTALLLLVIGGCGGSTRGSGGVTTVKGVVFDTDANPQPGITVTDPASGESTVTDEQGAYELSLPSPEGEIAQTVTLLFESEGFSAEGTVEGVTSVTEEVQTTVIIDRTLQAVAVVEEGRSDRERGSTDGDQEDQPGDDNGDEREEENTPDRGEGDRNPDDSSESDGDRNEDDDGADRPHRPRPEPTREPEPESPREPHRPDGEDGATDDTTVNTVLEGPQAAGGAA